ncbi:DUF805 domain-containing protein [Micrococcales bacterium 31B]|nr:DUF805 domain-containing protein [Micrococcales bacterium 31B]
MKDLAAYPGVNIFEAIRLLFSRYTDFAGRSSRSEFWFAFLAVTIVTRIFDRGQFVLIRPFSSGNLGDWFQVNESNPALSAVGLAVSIGLTFPLVAAAARRLRDSGRSPWLLFLVLLPAIGPIVMIVLLCQATAPHPVNEIPAVLNRRPLASKVVGVAAGVPATSSSQIGPPAPLPYGPAQPQPHYGPAQAQPTGQPYQQPTPHPPAPHPAPHSAAGPVTEYPAPGQPSPQSAPWNPGVNGQK